LARYVERDLKCDYYPRDDTSTREWLEQLAQCVRRSCGADKLPSASYDVAMRPVGFETLKYRLRE
jgi:hypothetical protein